MLIKQETKPETKQNSVHQFVRMRIAFFCGAHAVDLECGESAGI